MSNSQIRFSEMSRRGGKLITADWHVHCWQDGASFEDGVNTRLLDFARVFDQMTSYALKHEVQEIYVLGDIFHLKKNVPIQAFNLLWYLLDRAAGNYGFRFFFLAGNHDREIDREDSVTVLPFRSFAHVITDIEIDKKERVVFVPWLYDQEKVRKTLRDLKGDWATLYYHGEIDGGIVGPSDYRLRSLATPEFLQAQKFHKIFAGHLHKRQIVNRVQYPGSPLAKDWGELEKDKGFLHVLPSGEVESIETEYPCFIVHEAKKFREAQMKILLTAAKGSFLRLVLEEAPDPAFIAELEKVARLVQVKLVRIVSVTNLRSRDFESMEELIAEYVEERKVERENVETYVNYGLEVLKRT